MLTARFTSSDMPCPKASRDHRRFWPIDIRGDAHPEWSHPRECSPAAFACALLINVALWGAIVITASSAWRAVHLPSVYLRHRASVPVT